MARPDIGAFLGALAVFVLFAIFAHRAGWLGWADAAQWTDQSAQYGIVAVPVALLMIGGEFDLSAGVMVGSSGLLLGLLCLFMREPPRGAADGVAHRHASLRDYAGLLHIPSYVLCTLGMTAMTFAIGGVAVWVPTYYYEREAVYEVRPISRYIPGAAIPPSEA